MITCTLLKNTHSCRRRPTRTPIACLDPLLPTQNVSRKSKQSSFPTTAQRNVALCHITRSLIQKETINSQKPSVGKDAMFDRNTPHAASSWSQSLASPKNSVSNKLFPGTLGTRTINIIILKMYFISITRIVSAVR
jgi:hypothetical protein